jgi:hypothetical protein
MLLGLRMVHDLLDKSGGPCAKGRAIISFTSFRGFAGDCKQFAFARPLLQERRGYLLACRIANLVDIGIFWFEIASVLEIVH